MTTITDNPNFAVQLHSCGLHHDRRQACPDLGMRTIAAVDVQEYRDKDGKMTDRRIDVLLSCGHRYFDSRKRHLPVPRVGEPSGYHCPCFGASV